MSTRRSVLSLLSLLFRFLFLVLGTPVYAQETAAAAAPAMAQWSIITAGFALGIAAAGVALG